MFATVFQTLKTLSAYNRDREILAGKVIRLQPVLLRPFSASVNKNKIHVCFSRVAVCIFRRERSTDQEYHFSSLIRLTIENKKSSSLNFTHVA